MKEITIHTEDTPQRLDKYLRRLFPQAAGGFLYKMLRKKNITLNGHKATGKERLAPGDVVTVWFSDVTFQTLSGTDASGRAYERLASMPNDLSVLYEERDFILLHKPPGILTQKARGADCSLNERFLSYLIANNTLTEEQLRHYRPSVMNRLDRGTSGIVLAAKTLSGAQSLSEWISTGLLKKEYRCLVHGYFEIDESVVFFWKKNEEKNTVNLRETPANGYLPIETRFCTVNACEYWSLLEAVLVTGKSHQIRASLSALNHPIVLDGKYGDPRKDIRLCGSLSYPGHFLHAWRITLPDGRVFTDPMPQEFEAVMAQ